MRPQKSCSREGIHEGACYNLMLQDVITWLKEKYEVDVCKTTVGVCLHEMGLSYQQHTKEVYFDGHERDDVVASRRSYLNTLQSYENRMWVYTSHCPDPAIHPIIRVYHDESTYYSNSDQSFHWTDGTKQILKQKSLGQAIMVSHFIEEVGGLLECDGERPRDTSPTIISSLRSNYNK